MAFKIPITCCLPYTFDIGWADPRVTVVMKPRFGVWCTKNVSAHPIYVHCTQISTALKKMQGCFCSVHAMSWGDKVDMTLDAPKTSCWMQHNNTSFCGRANSCPKRETSNFFAFLVNSFFSVFQSVCEVGALCLDVAVLLEQLEALLDGLLVLGHRLLVARRLRVVLQSVQQHVGPVVSLQVKQEGRMKIINSLRQKSIF